MPDQDQPIGTLTQDSPLAADSSQIAAPAEVQDNSPVVETPAEQPTEGTPTETIGDALKEFDKVKVEATSQFPAKDGTQPAAQTPLQNRLRDYSGLTPEEVPLFKKMGDQAFNTLKPQYLEYKKLKEEYAALKTQQEETSKNSLYEHEKAYTLTPEYSEISGNLQRQTAEVTHWQQQLRAIRAGGKWTPLVLDAQGNVVYGAEQDPTPEAEDTVENQLAFARELKSSSANKLANLQTTFQNGHKGFLTQFAEVEQKLFAGVDAKLVDRAMETKLPLFPAHLRGQPVVRALAKALAVIDGLVLVNKRQASATTTSNIKARTAANAGPGGGSIQPTIQAGQKVGAVIAEFDKARALGLA